MAGSPMDVKKNFFVEEWNSLRETSEKRFEFTYGNAASIFMMYASAVWHAH